MHEGYTNDSVRAYYEEALKVIKEESQKMLGTQDRFSSDDIASLGLIAEDALKRMGAI